MNSYIKSLDIGHVCASVYALCSQIVYSKIWREFTITMEVGKGMRCVFNHWNAHCEN